MIEEPTYYLFDVDQRVVKDSGSYSATGKIRARFPADDGSPRYVFRFDTPAGLLHIFNETQLRSERREDRDSKLPTV